MVQDSNSCNQTVGPGQRSFEVLAVSAVSKGGIRAVGHKGIGSQDSRSVQLHPQLPDSHTGSRSAVSYLKQ